MADGQEVFISSETHMRNTVGHKQSLSVLCLQAPVGTTGAWAAASSLEGRVCFLSYHGPAGWQGHPRLSV